jgi:hypothetical protein
MSNVANQNMPLERTENAPTPRQKRLAYTLAKYEQMRLERAGTWQSWAGLRDLLSESLACGVNMGDSLINELCKQGHFEIRETDSGRQVKRRYDAPNIA